MDKIVLTGSPRLSGEVNVSGAKNAALPLLAASLLAEGEHHFSNVPDLADVATMLKLLRTMGCEISRSPNQCQIRVPAEITPEAPYDLVKTMRASVLVLGPLTAKYGRGRVSLPGGCAIGARPIDQHLKGLRQLGAEITLAEGYVNAESQRLRGGTVRFDMVTVTGTENLMMAAALARGTTVLENAACEPEIEDLAAYLSRMGAHIEGAGTPTIQIHGVERLNPTEHTVIPDRIEAGTLLVAGAMTQGDVTIRRAAPRHLGAVMQKLRDAGCEVTSGADWIRCQASRRPTSVNITTEVHPGFPTDMQAQLMVLMAIADGTSEISENIFENRFMHVPELQRMGAHISIDGPTAVVQGVESLSGAPVMATDLRASASLILAGLRARGRTEVQRVYHLDRGYERLDLKLQQLGADIQRVKV